MFGSYEKLLDVPLTPSIPALFQVFLVLPVPEQDTQSRKHSKMPPVPRAFSPFPGDKEAGPDPRVCTQRLPWKTPRNQQKTALGPKPLLRLPRMRHRELNPAGWELLQPLTPCEGTGTSLTPNPEAGAEQLFVTLGCSMELLPVPDCCSGRLTREHKKGFKRQCCPSEHQGQQGGVFQSLNVIFFQSFCSCNPLSTVVSFIGAWPSLNSDQPDFYLNGPSFSSSLCALE